ncbi:MAG: amidohydrolase family protein [Acidimicrobiia bacterium]
MTRILYQDAALADGRSDTLRLGVSVTVEDGRIIAITEGQEADPGRDTKVIDAGGTTIVPGMVDAHSHVTLSGGSHWIDRGLDETEELLGVAEHNAELLNQAGVRWARDVGAPRRLFNGRERALSLEVRERWSERRDRPYLRAAGTWLTVSDFLPAGLTVEVKDGEALLEAALQQLEEGADLLKLYLDGPNSDTSPFTAAEVNRVVENAHERDAKVTAHTTKLDGARVAAEGRVDSIEHGMELDRDVARDMATHGIALVSTLTVLRSWITFGQTTTLPRFAEEEGRLAIQERYERAQKSVSIAHSENVAIAAGTDFGGGSARANQLAWEVESLVKAGLKPWEGLAAATWRGGELLGEPDAGVVREGGPADFFLVHGDPLSDPSALWRVWRVAWLD